MKKFLLSIMCALFIIGAFAQAPQSFKYQAVARDNSGNLITEKQVSLKISILKSSVSGEIVYSETHQPTTNAYGLINLVIGKGTLVSGSLAGINWGNDAYFIKIEMDTQGGTNFTAIGTSQLLSVPFALYAEKARLSELDNDTSRTNELQNLAIDGNKLTISNGNAVTLPVSGNNPQFPKYTQIQIDTLTPVEGLIVYNSTEKKFVFSDGASWLTMDSKACAVNPPTPEAGNNIFTTSQTTVSLNATPVSTGNWQGPVPESGFDTDGLVTSTSNANTSFSGTECHKYKMLWMTESSCGNIKGDGLIISLGSAVGWIEAENGLNINLNALGTGTWSIESGTGGSISNSTHAATTFTGIAEENYTLRWTITNATCGTTTHDVTLKTTH